MQAIGALYAYNGDLTQPNKLKSISHYPISIGFVINYRVARPSSYLVKLQCNPGADGLPQHGKNGRNGSLEAFSGLFGRITTQEHWINSD